MPIRTLSRLRLALLFVSNAAAAILAAQAIVAAIPASGKHLGIASTDTPIEDGRADRLSGSAQSSSPTPTRLALASALEEVRYRAEWRESGAVFAANRAQAYSIEFTERAYGCIPAGRTWRSV